MQPDITAAEIQAFGKEKLKEMGGFMRLFTGFFSKEIPKLECWKKN